MILRKIVRSLLLKVPVINEVYNQRNELLLQTKNQQVQIIGLNRHYEELKQLYAQEKNPKLKADYVFSTNNLYKISSNDVKESLATTTQTLIRPKSAIWFLPPFQHLIFGGVYTIMRTMEGLSREGIENTIVIYGKDDFDVAHLSKQIEDNFKDLKYKIILFNFEKDKVDNLPKSDIGFCTFWDSAYLLLRFNKVKRKYYFIQDYEPLFYPAGSISALAESTYRFGFKGIVNTPGLFEALKDRHNISGISFMPAVDQATFFPEKKKKGGPTRIFFYARPNNPRNAFSLGAETIRILKEKYESQIEIITAGSHWDEKAFGLEGKVTNLGLIKTLKDVANLYRSCDIGFCFMLTRHPSYQPLEFMASGVATVTNVNESNEWLLLTENNCLLSEPSPQSMAEAIARLIDDELLRSTIIRNGIKATKVLSWEKEISQLSKTIINDRV